MTEPIGYNDEHFDDLPNEDASWNKMSQLLDKDERRRRVLPFWMKFSGLLVLMLAMGVGGWMIFSGKNSDAGNIVVNSPDRSGNPLDPASQEPVPGQQRSVQKETAAPQSNSNTNEIVNNTIVENHSSPIFKTVKETKIEQEKSAASNITGNQRRMDPNKDANSVDIGLSKIASDNKSTQKDRTGNFRKQDSENLSPLSLTVKPSLQKEQILPEVKTARVETGKADSTGGTKPTPAEATRPVSAASADVIVIPTGDSVSKTQPSVLSVDSSKTKEKAVADKTKKQLNRKPMQWTLGLLFLQPVAFSSQGMSDYNYRGKKSFIADHLPGLYFTAGKGKWYAGAEFSYAVPQPVEQVYFSQQTKFNNLDSNINRERYSIEKTYYHQLSASGNYFVLPQLSVGLGGMYSLLTGAVTEKEVRSKSVLNGMEKTVISLAPVKGYTDSFFFKSTASAFLHTEYHWKRIKLGARYTYALQPYMRYTKPDGEVFDVRNNTLQIMLRFQLWKK